MALPGIARIDRLEVPVCEVKGCGYAATRKWTMTYGQKVRYFCTKHEMKAFAPYAAETREIIRKCREELKEEKVA